MIALIALIALIAFSIFFLIPTIFKTKPKDDHHQEHPLQQDCYSIGWVFKRAAGELHVIVKAVVHLFVAYVTYVAYVAKVGWFHSIFAIKCVAQQDGAGNAQNQAHVVVHLHAAIHAQPVGGVLLLVWV